jgi:hypothetical protein
MPNSPQSVVVCENYARNKTYIVCVSARNSGSDRPDGLEYPLMLCQHTPRGPLEGTNETLNDLEPEADVS